MNDTGDRREENSRMAKVTMSCEGCDGVQTTSYDDWRKHLLEEGHQERARELVKTMTVEEKERTVVVFGVRVRGVAPKYILRHFGDMSFVANIVFFWGEREDFCIITFLYSRFREEVLKTSHVVMKRQVYLRPLDDIPENEWVSICPFAAPDSVKMEVDDANGNPSSEDYSDEGLLDIEAPAAAASRSCTATANDLKPLPATATAALDLSPAPEQSNGPLNPFVPKSEPDIADNEPISTSTLEHQSLVQSAAEITENDPDTTNMNPVTSSNNCQEFLNSVMEDFYNVNLMPETEWELRQYVTSHLQSILRDLFPNCLLIQYGIGSTALLTEFTGVAPLFLYADINGFTADRNPTDQHDMNNFVAVPRTETVTKISKHLKAHLNIVEFKLTHRDYLTFRYTNTTHEHVPVPVSMNCRIRISGFLTVQTNRLVHFLLKLDNRVRPLMILIRHWANHHKFARSNPGTENGSTCDFEAFDFAVFQWIVLFFFIHKKILPTVDSLQTLRDNYTRAPLIVQREDISFCDDAKALGWTKKNDYDKNPETQNPSATCVLELACELFRSFGDEENIRNSIISPNLGEYINKEELERERSSNNNGFKDYNKIKTYLGPKFNNRLVLQHPLKPGMNVAVGSSPELLQRFQEQCRFTAGCLFRLLNSQELQNPISLLMLPFSEKSISASRKEQPDEKRQKIDYKIRLQIRKKYEILQDTRVQKWLDLFEDFNNTVWPVCYGVKLYELESTLNAPKRAETFFLSAFKGVVTNPEVLASWAYEKQTAVDMFKLITTLYSSLSAEERKKREIEKPSTKSPNTLMDELVSFDCQVVGYGWNLGKENPNAAIELSFSNVWNQDARYLEGGGGRIFQNNLKATYTGLWKRHVQKVFGSTLTRKLEKPANNLSK